MPIDKEYRQSWHVHTKHDGHDVWMLDDRADTIHGTTVGVHLQSCIGCMKCVTACPTSVFSAMMFEKRAVVDPTNEDECILCMACEIVCPTTAIHVVRSGGSDETLDSLLN